MNIHGNCKNCGHPVLGYRNPGRDVWFHYRIGEGKKKGVTDISCFLCTCSQPEPDAETIERVPRKKR